MTSLEKAMFIAAMRITAQVQTELFSITDGDFYFLTNQRLPGWLVLALDDELYYIAEPKEVELGVAA